MKIKKYVGKTMPEIMQQIRQDLGPEAVILNTKEVKSGGFLGLFKKKSLEVFAALDPKPLTRSPKRSHVNELDEEARESKDNQSVLQEIQELKKLVKSQVTTNLQFSPNYLLIYKYLIDQEVDGDLAKQILEEIDQGDELTTDAILSSLKNHLTDLLAEKVSVNEKVEEKIIHFVGPTGVGKTTTLAKIAADYILKKNKRIAFITTDTYRIAAIDQLKTYAKILGVPVEVAYSKEDYVRAVEKFENYDYIYVDTAGRNFREEKFLKDLAATVHMHESSRTYLVLTLTAKPKDILEIFNRFHNLKVDDIIFTKIDETKQYGSILNIALNHRVKISYLTNGQDVPNDIIQPNASYITDLILGDSANE